LALPQLSCINAAGQLAVTAKTDLDELALTLY
jgi:hypothetical protein